MFIRRFMTSEYVIMFSDGSYFVSAICEEEIFDYLNQKYKTPDKAFRYSKDEMYWIGYIYAAISMLYNLRPKLVYKLFPAKKIREYYFIYHTFDIEAAERMIENIGFETDINKRAYELLKKLEYASKH